MRRVVGERFLLGEPLGRGGMGVVFSAVDLLNGSPCAVKLLKEDIVTDSRAQQRFLREMANGHRLHHPGIVRTIASGETMGTLWLAMELVPGRSLDAYLEIRGPMSPSDAASCISQLANALGHAHNVGIVHRDVKPSNVMIDDHDSVMRVVLLDLGIAKAVDESTQELTTVGVAVGTVAFMAPEARAGKRVDARADVYSLAVLSAWLLAGRIPLAAWAVPLQPHMYGPRRPWPEAMDVLLETALASEVSSRTRSPETFAADFVGIVQGKHHWPERAVAEANLTRGLRADAPTQPWHPEAVLLPDAPPLAAWQPRL